MYYSNLIYSNLITVIYKLFLNEEENINLPILFFLFLFSCNNMPNVGK